MKQIPYSDRLNATYGALEAKLAKEGYNVLHLMRDTRGDWGDDRGYMIVIANEPNLDLIRVFIVEVNANFELHQIDFQDCAGVYVHTIQQAQEFLDNLVKGVADRTLRPDMDADDWDDVWFWETMFAPYVDYTEQDNAKLLNLTKTLYVPNYVYLGEDANDDMYLDCDEEGIIQL